VDSSGCTECRLQLIGWENCITEVDSLFANKVSFLFFFHPKDSTELEFLLKLNNFDYHVFIDKENEIMRLNNFPSQPEYQCYLLDKDYKVIAIGNPVYNSKIWDLYKQLISEHYSCKHKM